jgi:hypothetical protein
MYHVMNGGDRRETIFEDDQDCANFLKALAEATPPMPFDATLPAAHSQISSMELHNQINGLKPRTAPGPGLEPALGTLTSLTRLQEYDYAHGTPRACNATRRLFNSDAFLRGLTEWLGEHRKCMFDTRKLDRFCAGILRWFFVGCLCLVGVFLLMLSLLALVGMQEPGPPRNMAVWIPVSLALFAAGIGWLVGVVWLVGYLRRRRNRHDRVS